MAKDEDSSQTSDSENKAVDTLRKSRGEGAIVGGTRDFLHFLLDYDIVSFTIAFIVAGATSKMISSGVSSFIQYILQTIGTRAKDIGEFGNATITLIVILLLCFLFIYLIFQPLVTSKTIAEERRLRELVKTAEDKQIEEDAEKVTNNNSKPMMTRFAMF